MRQQQPVPNEQAVPDEQPLCCTARRRGVSGLWHPFADMAAVDGGELLLVRGEDVLVGDEDGHRYLVPARATSKVSGSLPAPRDPDDRRHIRATGG